MIVTIHSDASNQIVRNISVNAISHVSSDPVTKTTTKHEADNYTRDVITLLSSDPITIDKHEYSHGAVDTVELGFPDLHDARKITPSNTAATTSHRLPRVATSQVIVPLDAHAHNFERASKPFTRSVQFSTFKDKDLFDRNKGLSTWK